MYFVQPDRLMASAYGDKEYVSLVLQTLQLIRFSVLPWCLDEKTGIEHIKYAYEQGVNTFE
jgi:hypothetical protein